MLKSRGSINCRPSRGRGRHNWSRNAVGSSSSARTWGPAASCRRKLRSREKHGAAASVDVINSSSESPAQLWAQLGSPQAAQRRRLCPCPRGTAVSQWHPVAAHPGASNRARAWPKAGARGGGGSTETRGCKGSMRLERPSCGMGMPQGSTCTAVPGHRGGGHGDPQIHQHQEEFPSVRSPGSGSGHCPQAAGRAEPPCARDRAQPRRIMSHEGTVREWPKCGTSREVPAPLGQPEGPCGGLPAAEEAKPEPSSFSQHLQPEAETWQPQGQRQVPVPEPWRGEPPARQDTQQQKLEPAQALASVRALQLDLDFCRGMNRERLVQLQQQERAVEQKHQDFIFLMQQYQAVIGKDQKDEVVQTEVTSSVAAHSHSDSSYNIPRKARTELLMQPQPRASCSAQRSGRACAWGADTQPRAHGEAKAEQGAGPKPAGSSEAAAAPSREPDVRLRAELSRWQWKQQVTLEQALQHMHAAAHAQEKLQRSQEQLQALREQLGAQKEQSQGLWHSVAWLQQELGATQAREQRRLQQLSGATETIQELQQEVASARKRLAELLQEVQDIATLQAELAQAQQEKAKQEEKAAAYKEERQQLLWELRELQECQEQSKQEAQTLQERLRELSSRAQHWQQLHQASEQALATREKELVVCKLELSFLKEELSKATEQIETLRSSQALARCESSRTHEDRELVLVNISQCLVEQMQVHERQGHKTQQQSEQTRELTGSGAELSVHSSCCCCLQGCRGQTDNCWTARAPASPRPPGLPTRHLQDAVSRLQEENTCLAVRTRENKCERLKVSGIRGAAWPDTGPLLLCVRGRLGWGCLPRARAMGELPLWQHGPALAQGWALCPLGQRNSVPCPSLHRTMTRRYQPCTILQGCLHPTLASRTRSSAKQSKD
ncbi:polyamine-modulated factor 1-binding protein 1 isoform X2 [Strix uralensis]|uniref:polyamine-modulated factor 1-binding protein 1 isoform X2 n=1 Tax=Strix uralensis TaxID=36305 RepID=UPI003DA3A8E1